jgi:SAM-dependent methyltransferase
VALSDELTDIDFWENYWTGITLPSSVDLNHSFDRCLSVELQAITEGISGTIFEIGCAPGKWIGHLSIANKLVPCGIEYSPLGQKATLKNFEILNIKAGDLYIGDFFKIEPEAKYDIVMSLGFIEHFEDPGIVIERHLQWLKSGGLLILGIPNFTGLYKWAQYILDKTLLDKHNLSIMNESYFLDIATRLNLERKSFKYVGSFEPDLPIPKVRFGNAIQILIKCTLIILRELRRFKVFDNFNNKYVSGYILSSFQKK